MEIIIIIVSIIIIFSLVYGNSRMLTINKSSIYNENKLVQKLFKKQSSFEIASDILITMLEFLISGIVVEFFLGPMETTLFVGLYGRVSYVIIKYISILIITVIATYFTMIIGIYVPKHIVHMRKKHKFNDSFILYLYEFFNYLFLPITFLASKLDTIVKEKVNTKNDIEEVREFTNKGIEKGTITKVEKDIMERTISGLDIPLTKVCTKMENVISTSTKEGIKSIKEKFGTYPISRLLVYSDKKIIGYIHIKDILLNEQKLINKEITLKDIVRNVAYIDEDKTLEDALIKFKKEKCKLFIVIDSEKNNIGIITMGDIINKIVGK